MKKTAYLVLSVNTKVVPPAIIDAKVARASIARRRIIGFGPILSIELLSTEGSTFEEAKRKLLDMVSGRAPSGQGDLRFLWPFLARGRRAHEERAVIRPAIRRTLAAMPTTVWNLAGIPPRPWGQVVVPPREPVAPLRDRGVRIDSYEDGFANA